MQENDNFLWVEKYRPHKIDDCILPDSLKETFKKFLSQGESLTYCYQAQQVRAKQQLLVPCVKN